MSDAREAFQNLQAVTGRGFDTTALHADWDEVEQRIARHRAGRVMLSSIGALAVIRGVVFAAMAMPSGGDASPAVPPSATSSSATIESSNTDQAPPDAPPTQAPAMSVFGEPYPAGMSAPNLVDLIAPGLGGRYISETDTDYVVGLLRPDAAGHTVEVPVPFPKGNVLVLAATHWECAWITEYVWASEANDPERRSAAAAQLTKFPDLEVIQKYNPQLAQGDYLTRIVGGDVEFAKRWLNTSCSGVNP